MSELAETKFSPNTAQTTTRKCRTHGLVLHWKRGEDWLCESCHPNPQLSGRGHVGNPVEGERDSGLKLNTIPL